MTKTNSSKLGRRFQRVIAVIAFIAFGSSIASAQQTSAGSGEIAPAVTGVANTDKSVAQDKGAAPGPAVPPAIEVAAVEVVEKNDSCKLRIAAMLGHEAKAAVTDDAATCKWMDASPEKRKKSQILVGAGDVIAVVGAQTYDAATRYQQSGQHKLYVFFSGFNVTDDAELLAVEQYGKYYFLRYHLKPGAQSRELWAAMIRANQSMTGTTTLAVSYGWSDAQPNSVNRAEGLVGAARLAVTTGVGLAAASGACLLLLLLSGTFAYRTSMLRDPVPADATGQSEQTARSMPFSLSRVQLFSWFMFALLSGVFLKLIYTELPALDGSILALLGISTGAGALSWTIDKSLETPSDRSGTISQGFWLDLVTGPRGDYQVHRMQAVLVNITLLLIGVFHVVTSIAYPTFDQSWLIFLTISGGTYAFGKQMAEKNPVAAASQTTGA